MNSPSHTLIWVDMNRQPIEGLRWDDDDQIDIRCQHLLTTAPWASARNAGGARLHALNQRPSGIGATGADPVTHGR